MPQAGPGSRGGFRAADGCRAPLANEALQLDTKRGAETEPRSNSRWTLVDIPAYSPAERLALAEKREQSERPVFQKLFDTLGVTRFFAVS